MYSEIKGKPNGTNSVVNSGTRFSQLAESDPSSEESNSSSEDEMESASEGHISEEEDRRSEPYTGICSLSVSVGVNIEVDFTRFY